MLETARELIEINLNSTPPMSAIEIVFQLVKFRVNLLLAELFSYLETKRRIIAGNFEDQWKSEAQ